MGCRIIDHLKPNPAYRLLCMEVSPTGLQNLAQRGIQPIPQQEALPQGDVVILALPDRVLGKVAFRFCSGHDQSLSGQAVRKVAADCRRGGGLSGGDGRGGASIGGGF